MDSNRIFHLLLVAAECLQLFQLLKLPKNARAGFDIILITVLLLTLFLPFILPQWGLMIAVGAWFILWMIPTLIHRRIYQLMSEKKIGKPLHFSKIHEKNRVTIALIVINLACFIGEMATGGATKINTFFVYGAFHVEPVLQGKEFWRLLTANFLHFGFQHLTANMVSLFIVGPYMESLLGGFRYLTLYLLSGIGAMALSLIFSNSHLIVGASGCIMGLLGGMTVFFMMHYRRSKSMAASNMLKRMAFIFSLQIAMDLLIVQSSLTAHLSGAAIGFCIGLLLLKNIK